MSKQPTKPPTGAASADPKCPECYGNGYRWNNMLCWCCTTTSLAQENVLIIKPPKPKKK